MTQELNDKLKAQIEQILAEKLPEQGSPTLTKLKEKAMTRLRERLPYVLVPLAIDLILSPDDKQLGERIEERFRYVLTALIIEVILLTIHEELGKLGRSKPCKHITPKYAPLCGKGKEWGSLCLDCEDYGPMETWTCHICKRERPDDKISVLTKPLAINGRVVGEQNIRYCNDNPACIEGAQHFSFFWEGKD